ncbi:hypothetical protein [Algoriphagus sp.]|uniref:hypothetical protein n=1 Tax=Algoriphagus sp. TaxID=1872435 RepID=UPI003918C413
MFKKLMNVRMRSGIASVAVLVCLAWAGIDFNASGESEFVEVKVALENAIAGSESQKCYQRMTRCNNHLTVYHCDKQQTGYYCSTYEIGCLFC